MYNDGKKEEWNKKMKEWENLKNRGDWRERWEVLDGLELKDMFLHPMINRSIAGCQSPTADRYIEQVEYVQKYIKSVVGI